MAKFTFDKEISYFKTDASTRSTMKLLNSILVTMLLFLTVIFFILLHLEVNQSPAVSDIIILPEGGSERILKAAELLDEGYSASGKVLITPFDPEELQLPVSRSCRMRTFCQNTGQPAPGQMLSIRWK